MNPIKLTRLATVASAMMFASTASANPVPADEMSLLNGADLFTEHCTECHGWNPADQYTDLYSEDPVDVEDPLRDLLNPRTEPEPEPDFTEDLDSYWPEYAERPEPDEAAISEDEQLRSDMLGDITSAIDDVYNADTEAWGWDQGDYEEYQTYEEMVGSADDFDPEEELARERNRPRPGATDLTDPRAYLYGTAETDLFNSIAKGTGPTMPGFLTVLGNESAVWDLVNYIRSLWGADFDDG